MSANQLDEATEHLQALAQKIDTTKMPAPAFMMVVTATEFAYQMKNGIWVVPLACLKN